MRTSSLFFKIRQIGTCLRIEQNLTILTEIERGFRFLGEILRKRNGFHGMSRNQQAWLNFQDFHLKRPTVELTNRQILLRNGPNFGERCLGFHLGINKRNDACKQLNITV